MIDGPLGNLLRIWQALLRDPEVFLIGLIAGAIGAAYLVRREYVSRLTLRDEQIARFKEDMGRLTSEADKLRSLPRKAPPANPDAVFQFGKEVGMASGSMAKPGGMTFRTLAVSESFVAQEPFTFRDLELLITHFDQHTDLRMGSIVDLSYGNVTCSIVGRASGEL